VSPSAFFSGSTSDAHRRAVSLLDEHAGLLETVAQSLLELQRLDRGELQALRASFLEGVRFPRETSTSEQENSLRKESVFVGSATRLEQERRPVIVKRRKTRLARRFVRNLIFRRRRLRAS
jgi:hypothetical protein